MHAAIRAPSPTPTQLANLITSTSTVAVDLARPALRLVQLYLSQACCTTVYISLLSYVGERLSERVKLALFKSSLCAMVIRHSALTRGTAVLEQDIVFFDANNSGDLVARLTADVQEFKVFLLPL